MFHRAVAFSEVVEEIADDLTRDLPKDCTPIDIALRAKVKFKQIVMDPGERVRSNSFTWEIIHPDLRLIPVLEWYFGVSHELIELFLKSRLHPLDRVHEPHVDRGGRAVLMQRDLFGDVYRQVGPNILDLWRHFPKAPLVQVANRFADLCQDYVVTEWDGYQSETPIISSGLELEPVSRLVTATEDEVLRTVYGQRKPYAEVRSDRVVSMAWRTNLLSMAWRTNRIIERGGIVVSRLLPEKTAVAGSHYRRIYDVREHPADLVVAAERNVVDPPSQWEEGVDPPSQFE